MTKFIKLTEPYGNGIDRPLIINCDAIRSIKMGDKGKDTLVNLTESNTPDGRPNKFYFVKETVEQIWALLTSMSTIEYEAYVEAEKRRNKHPKELTAM